jgi:NAD(P)-dependent dehydrogenase (short-subunit alcohol dehydrogenase family)
MSGGLDGKVAVVTGGCSGMGLGTVELFVERGARVVVADIQVDKGKALEERYPGSVAFAACDIAVEDELAGAIAMAEDRFGGLDCLFNNAAAGGASAPVDALSSEDWDRSQELILRSVMLGTKHAVPLMRRRGGGAVINTSSGTAVAPFGTRGVTYGTMKAGVLHMSRLLASELGRDRIRVNAIIPGWITTSIVGTSMGASREVADRMVPLLRESFAGLQPIPVAGTPRHIAEAVAFLASDAASWITGVALPVDGGLLVRNQSEPTLGEALQQARRRAEAKEDSHV